MALDLPADVNRTLQKALRRLTRERGRIDRQISTILRVLNPKNVPAGVAAVRRKLMGRRSRRRMSAAARRALSTRMKAYWAKRRGEAKAKGRRAK